MTTVPPLVIAAALEVIGARDEEASGLHAGTATAQITPGANGPLRWEDSRPKGFEPLTF
jgi:hypothetical protein